MEVHPIPIYLFDIMALFISSSIRSYLQRYPLIKILAFKSLPICLNFLCSSCHPNLPSAPRGCQWALAPPTSLPSHLYSPPWCQCHLLASMATVANRWPRLVRPPRHPSTLWHRRADHPCAMHWIPLGLPVRCYRRPRCPVRGRSA